MGGPCSTNGGNEKCVQNLVGKPKGNRTLGRHKRRREDNIRVGLTEVRWVGVDCMYLAEERDQ
jgi:hypothetical protein